ncbi:MAG: Clp1/GlmU family protein [Nitrososphaera sp.]
MKVIMVRGPATVRAEGACSLLGMDISGKTVQVRAGRALPFEPAHGCILHVQGGETWDADPASAGTTMWTRLAERILGMAGRRLVVMLVGGTDTGKSTLSTYLANVAIGRDIFPCIIDGDIGQGDLAPPAAIGAALVRQQVADLRDVPAGYYEFVGSVTPSGSERLVAGSMRSIFQRTRKISSMHIINTDGYVADGGVAYKRMLARALRPDVIVCIGRDGLASALARGPWVLLRARSSGQAAKTRSDRVGRRMDQFTRHVGEGSATVQQDRIRLVYRERPTTLLRAASLFAPSSMEGMFVGLGRRGTVTGFGVIESIGDEMRIRTGVRDFDTVYLSNIALRGGMEERLS